MWPITGKHRCGGREPLKVASGEEVVDIGYDRGAQLSLANPTRPRRLSVNTLVGDKAYAGATSPPSVRRNGHFVSAMARHARWDKLLEGGVARHPNCLFRMHIEHSCIE